MNEKQIPDIFTATRLLRQAFISLGTAVVSDGIEAPACVASALVAVRTAERDLAEASLVWLAHKTDDELNILAATYTGC